MPEIKDKGMSERFDERFDKKFFYFCNDERNIKAPIVFIKEYVMEEIQQALQRERDLWLEKLPLYRAGVLDVSAGETYESRKSRNDTLKEIKEIIK